MTGSPTDYSSASTCYEAIPLPPSHARHARSLRSCANQQRQQPEKAASPFSSARSVMAVPMLGHQAPCPPSLPGPLSWKTCTRKRSPQSPNPPHQHSQHPLKPTKRPTRSRPCFYRGTRSYRPTAPTPPAAAYRSWATRSVKMGPRTDGECACRAEEPGSMKVMLGE